jgi:hypothetical protein
MGYTCISEETSELPAKRRRRSESPSRASQGDDVDTTRTLHLDQQQSSQPEHDTDSNQVQGNNEMAPEAISDLETVPSASFTTRQVAETVGATSTSAAIEVLELSEHAQVDFSIELM